MNILHIEDSREDAELVQNLLEGEWPDCKIRVTSDREDLIKRLHGEPFDLILSDFSMGAFTGLDALRIVQERCPETPFIFLSGTIGEDRAIEAVKAGAQDYVLKDRMKRLITAIHRAMRDSNARRERGVAEQRIREQAELLNKAHDAIMVTNLAGLITFWNQGAERISGWTSAEVLGRKINEVLGTGAHAGIESARLELEKKDEWSGEFHLHNKAGKLLIMDISATLIRDEQGQPKARLSIGTDVTEKKKLEEQFLRVQRLESIGMLASGIAHDLNNVLAPILMAAPVLRIHATNPTDIRIIASLEKGAERGAGLVRQILSFAHGVSGAQQLIQVKHLVMDTINVIHETFPKNITLEDKIPNDLWPIMANPTQVHQVLLNLCVNARDAMPNGGKLTIRAENCLLDYKGAKAIEGGSAGAFLVLHVEDSGTGIPPDVLTHIWEPFYTTKGVGKGTGLGLSTVRGIVEQHKGFIDLQTILRRGTSFRVYLPSSEGGPKSEASDSAHPFAFRGDGELILIADDESTIREITAATLSQYGYRVLVAKDGIEGVALFAKRNREISAVITDMGMPNLDGANLAYVVHQLNPEVKILVMSGMSNADPDPKTVGYASAFMVKPFKAEALLEMVHKLLHPERAGSPPV